MGAICASLHAANGVRLRTGVGVTALRGHDRVTGVELSDGSVLDADLVLVGVGAAPVTEWLEGSGLQIDNGVVTDAHGLTSISLSRRGRRCRACPPDRGPRLRIGSSTGPTPWRTRRAPSLRCSAATSTRSPTLRAPYFWSDQYGVMIQFAGHREPSDPVRVVEGDPEAGSFVAVYDHGDQVSAVIAMNAGRSFNKLRRQLTPRHGPVPA